MKSPFHLHVKFHVYITLMGTSVVSALGYLNINDITIVMGIHMDLRSPGH